MNINDKLKELGFATISEDFYSKVQEWKSWYIGDVKGFHRYKVRNGTSMVRCKRYTLNMGKKIPEDWANLLMNEKVEITLEGQREQEFIDLVFAENNFLVQVNEMQEKAFALGTVAFIPRVVGMEATEFGPIPGSASGIVMDYVTVEHISTIQGTYITKRFILGGYQAEYQFKLIYRIKPGESNDKRLEADELLNHFGDWARKNLPDLGDEIRALRVEPTTQSSKFAAYEGGYEDYQILMKLTYEVGV